MKKVGQLVAVGLLFHGKHRGLRLFSQHFFLFAFNDKTNKRSWIEVQGLVMQVCPSSILAPQQLQEGRNGGGIYNTKKEKEKKSLECCCPLEAWRFDLAVVVTLVEPTFKVWILLVVNPGYSL